MRSCWPSCYRCNSTSGTNHPPRPAAPNAKNPTLSSSLSGLCIFSFFSRIPFFTSGDSDYIRGGPFSRRLTKEASSESAHHDSFHAALFFSRESSNVHSAPINTHTHKSCRLFSSKQLRGRGMNGLKRRQNGRVFNSSNKSS